jgi:site-specific recombinase XerD
VAAQRLSTGALEVQAGGVHEYQIEFCEQVARTRKGTAMNELVLFTDSALPGLIDAAGDQARMRFLEFFTANIRNANTPMQRLRKSFWPGARSRACRRAVQPVHVATYIERLAQDHSMPTVKVRLAAIRHLFDWLVVGQVVRVNPAPSVRGPRHVVKKGKAPVLSPDEARRLLDSIDISTDIGLRDRALIGLMVYSFARVGAALAVKVEDVFVQNRRLWVRLHEKGGKHHEMPCVWGAFRQPPYHNRTLMP